MNTPTSFRLSQITRYQLDALAERYGNQITVITVAIDRLYREEIMDTGTARTAREYVGYNQTISGEHTEEELTAARAVGFINAYMVGVFDVIEELKTNLPEGWHLTPGNSTHSFHPAAPNIPAAANEPILMGFVRAVHGDPHYPLWLWKSN